MAVGVASGKSGEESLAEWQRGTGIILQDRRNGVPTAYQGVWIFNNGYDEFLQAARQR